ncbi:gametocyte-specific factor 1 [Chanos chanos]|uniref:Gametocyte-specific factor 1 n=1 Tax=Chanos chanos TaxID=29144 RepID=A0A6J2V2X2_CHACN|nr:gametocyte-specific factor 1-like [Chanos chanos]
MSTIRFGTSCGPSTVNGARETFRGHDDETVEEIDDCDPNKILQCPYDKNHHIRAKRFPFHLIKCAKNHPKLASEMKTCPFNAKHLMPQHELAHHIANCVDRRPDNPKNVDTNSEMLRKFHVPVNTATNPISEEDWDQEADDSAITFVWGVSTNKLDQDRPGPTTTNHLKPGVRAPKTLPWKL